jgi:hypothetical protein
MTKFDGDDIVKETIYRLLSSNGKHLTAECAEERIMLMKVVAEKFGDEVEVWPRQCISEDDYGFFTSYIGARWIATHPRKEGYRPGVWSDERTLKEMLKEERDGKSLKELGISRKMYAWLKARTGRYVWR